jgi:hypothetical protein
MLTITAVTFQPVPEALTAGRQGSDRACAAGIVAVRRDERRTLAVARLHASRLRRAGATETRITREPTALPIGPIISAVVFARPRWIIAGVWEVPIHLTIGNELSACPACNSIEYILSDDGSYARLCHASITCRQCAALLPTYHDHTGPTPYAAGAALLHRIIGSGTVLTTVFPARSR